METVIILYIDDKIDLYVSKYLNSYSQKGVEYQYLELKFEKDTSYENLLEKEDVQKADILILDSMLFENSSAKNNKITGEELGFIIKKIFPFKEIIIVTQYEEKLEYNVLNKYNKTTYSNCNPDFYFKENWEKAIINATKNVILNRKILKTISSKKYIEKYLFEKMENSINGRSDYDNLKQTDIDELINTFEEMRKSYEKDGL